MIRATGSWHVREQQVGLPAQLPSNCWKQSRTCWDRRLGTTLYELNTGRNRPNQTLPSHHRLEAWKPRAAAAAGASLRPALALVAAIACAALLTFQYGCVEDGGRPIQLGPVLPWQQRAG